MWNYVDVFKKMEREKKMKADREKKLRSRSNNFRLPRMTAEVRVGGILKKSDFIAARLFMNDFSPKMLRLFISQPVEVDTKVSVNLLDEKTFYTKGRIVRCVHYSMDSHIITDQSYPYRIDIALEFRNEREKMNTESYCRSLYHRYVLGDLSYSDGVYEDKVTEIKRPSRVFEPEKTSPLLEKAADIPDFEGLDLFSKGA